ncbi:hypothetical protein [Piscinibacter sakaiensis]|uniref:hypothetical protein n=1 Tax=Piscinibacter sakaiensis TaxID=1547922 RepID=UPI003AAD8008
MKPETLDKIIWPFIFAGLVFGGFGLSLRSSSEPIGWALVVLGTLLIVLGAVMIYLRSRHDERN